MADNLPDPCYNGYLAVIIYILLARLVMQRVLEVQLDT
jgi:hypothetical protein